MTSLNAERIIESFALRFELSIAGVHHRTTDDGIGPLKAG